MRLLELTQKTDQKLKADFEKIFDQILKQEQPAFLKILDQKDLTTQCQEVYSRFAKSEQVVVLGVGGSSLGARALNQIFRGPLRFFENVDAYEFSESIRDLDDKTHFIVISKSGSTLETLAQLSFLQESFLARSLNISKNCTVITEEKTSPLYDWALQNNIPTLEIPLELGGRFSVLSAVGLYPALFMKTQIQDLVAGGKLISEYKSECAEFCAQIIMSFGRQEMITVFWAYSDLLKEMGLWVQQLWSESLGKRQTLNGEKASFASTPLPLIGTNDQHSVLQQIIEGQKDKFLVFIRNLQSEQAGRELQNIHFENISYLKGRSLGEVLKAQYVGTQKALANEGVHSVTLEMKDFSEKSVGLYFVFFEMCVAMLGKHHNINTYNQPGVELSKKIAVDLLKSKS